MTIQHSLCLVEVFLHPFFEYQIISCRLQRWLYKPLMAFPLDTASDHFSAAAGKKVSGSSQKLLKTLFTTFALVCACKTAGLLFLIGQNDSILAHSLASLLNPLAAFLFIWILVYWHRLPCSYFLAKQNTKKTANSYQLLTFFVKCDTVN